MLVADDTCKTMLRHFASPLRKAASLSLKTRWETPDHLFAIAGESNGAVH